MNDYTGSQFEIIAKAKQALLDSTNIESSPDEMKVLKELDNKQGDPSSHA